MLSASSSLGHIRFCIPPLSPSSPFNTPTDSVFKTLTRNIQHIGAGLSHSKELRDIFEDLVEKVGWVAVAACCHAGTVHFLLIAEPTGC